MNDFLIQRGAIRYDGNDWEGNDFFIEIYINDPDNPGTFSLEKTIQSEHNIPYDWTPSMHGGYDRPFSLLIGDFDGDGITDFSYSRFINGKVSWYIEYINADLSAQGELIPTGANGWGSIDSAQIGDFDGDQKIDILLLRGNLSTVIRSLNRTLYDTLFNQSGYFLGTDRTFVGDFNGDGLSDVMAYDFLSSIKWELYISTGKGWEFPYQTNLPWENMILNTTAPDPYDSYPPYAYIADVDGNGKTDVVFVDRNNGPWEVVVYYRKNNFWTSSTIPLNSYVGYSMTKGAEHLFRLGNFSRTGQPQLYFYASANSKFLLTFRPYDKSKYVRQILDGFNRLTTFEYKSLLEPSVYSRGNIRSYPNPSIIGPNKVVSHIEQEDFSEEIYTDIDYNYQKARVNLKGLGFLGYETISETDNIMNIQNLQFSELISESGSSENSWPLLPVGSRSQFADDYEVIQSNEVEYKPDVLQTFDGNFNYQPLVSTNKNKDFVNISSSVHSYSYDNYGNKTEEENILYENTSHNNPFLKKSTTWYNNYLSNGSWIPWQPQEVETEVERNGSTPVTSEITYQYFSNGDLQSQTEEPGTAVEVLTEYLYDNFGHVRKTTVTPNGMDPRAHEVLGRDASHRYVTEEINPMGWSTEYEYNHSLVGSPTKITDENDLETLFEYDSFGRQITVTYADGTEKNDVLAWMLQEPRLYRSNTNGTAMPVQETFYDGREREILSRVKNRNDDWVNQATVYNTKGQLWKKSDTYFDGGTPHTTTYQYDNYGRIGKIISPLQTITKEYSGREITTNNTTLGRTHTKIHDGSGKILQVIDTENNDINYIYNSFDKPASISAGSAYNTTIMKYDEFGRQDTLIDPVAGVTAYSYNALGDLVYQSDANGNTYTMTYDKLGRMEEKIGNEGTYSYEYDQSFLGKVSEITSPYSTATAYEYNSLGHIENHTETIDGIDYTMNYQYNAVGKLQFMTYPNSFKVEYKYDSYGYSTEILDEQTQVTFWEYQDENHLGQVTNYKLGNVNWTDSYSSYGTPASTVASNNNWNYQYSFNDTTGNLSSRSHPSHGNLGESFSYDALDRLKEYGRFDPLNINYFPDGSIKFKTDAGDYDYKEEYPGRVNSIENNPGTISHEKQKIDYTPFNSVAEIGEDNFHALFTYGADQQRRKMVITQKKDEHYIERKYPFLGLYEISTDDKSKDTYYAYVPTPSGHQGLYLQKGNNPGDFHFIIKDYLGSALGLTGLNGVLQKVFSFDAWGNRRDPSTWSNEYNPGQNQNLFSGFLYRGFTNHEHLDCFGLINMNGRLYDPLLGRMLSPDNFVQNATSTQNFNRYSYVLNNPLKYTDPNGEFIVEALVIGAFINVAIQSVSGNINSVGDFALSLGIGAAAGAVGAGVGAGISSAIAGGSSFFNGAAIGASSGFSGAFIGETGNSWMNGSSFGDGLMTGLKAGSIGAITGGLVGGVIGGISAVKDSRRFFDGATVSRKTIINQNMPIVSQNADANCLPAAVESVDDSFGGNLTQNQIRYNFGGNPNTNPLSDGYVWNYYSKTTGREVMGAGVKNLGHIKVMMQNGYRVNMTLNNGVGTLGHSVNMNAIYETTITKLSGRVISKLSYEIMDPFIGAYRSISGSSILNSTNIFYIK